MCGGGTGGPGEGRGGRPRDHGDGFERVRRNFVRRREQQLQQRLHAARPRALSAGGRGARGLERAGRGAKFKTDIKDRYKGGTGSVPPFPPYCSPYPRRHGQRNFRSNVNTCTPRAAMMHSKSRLPHASSSAALQSAWRAPAVQRCVAVSCTTCPVSTEGWTRRVHFVREGGGGGGRLDEPPRARRASPAHEQPERTRAEPRHCEDAPAAAAAQRVLSRRVRYGRWTFTRVFI